MKPAVAIAELEKLKAEAESDPLGLKPSQPFASWRSRVEAVLTKSLGPDHAALAGFKDVRYFIGVSWGGGPEEERIDREYFVKAVGSAVGYIDAAIYDLRLSMPADEPVDLRAFDPELWEHVRGLVDAEEWGKVASQTAIFVEDRLRTWTGHPKDKNGADLHGKELFLSVLGDVSVYRLGRTKPEIEGWRALGVGFVQALSNVDRHRIQKRDDARRYAIGVLGLGSLILTQLRQEHADHFTEE